MSTYGSAWSHEAYDFTPWLAENLERLSVELGLELELEGQEVDVGSYRADIVARVPQTDDRVLIENQLEFADLQHLGQVLAYLAGLEAKIVVWIAKGFRDEHISAIRWLNEHTVDPFAFFAVQVGVVQIGNSELAPVFEVLERPTEWDRQVQEAGQSGELTEIGKLNLRLLGTYLLSKGQRLQNYDPATPAPMSGTVSRRSIFWQFSSWPTGKLGSTCLA